MHVTVAVQFTHDLVEVVPELSSLLHEHLLDQEGELLPYVFMAEVAGWLHEQSTRSPKQVERALAWLEARFRCGSFDVRNLIDVGVIEMLPALPEGERILAMLPADLRSRAEVAGLFQG